MGKSKHNSSGKDNHKNHAGSANKNKFEVLNESNNKKNKKKSKQQEQHEDFEPLNKQLQPLGLVIKEVNGDGNCLFRSVSDQIDGGEHNHEFYRLKTVDYMLANADHYGPFLEVPIKDYCAKMRKTGTWAGHLELNALSLCCQVNIVVHQRDSPTYNIANFDSKHKTIHLSYHMGEHYNSVRFINDKFEKLHKISSDPFDSSLVDYSKTEKIIMDSTGTKDLQYVRRVLKENEYDQDAAIEFIIMEQNVERTRQAHLSKAATSSSSSSSSSGSAVESKKEPRQENNNNNNKQQQTVEPSDDSYNEEDEKDSDILMDCLPSIIEATGCDDIALIRKILRNYSYDVNETVNHILNHQNLEAALQEQDEKIASNYNKDASKSASEAKPLTRREKRAIEQMEKRKAVEQGKYLTKKELAKRAKEQKEAEFNKGDKASKDNDDDDDGDNDDGIDLEKVKAAAKQQQTAGIRI